SGRKMTELSHKKEYVPSSVQLQSLIRFAAELCYLAALELARLVSCEAARLAYVGRDRSPLMREVNQSGCYNH
ncbi:F0F1 ATP synthase subunit alpha, partial [Klebsiella pneumoniae]